MAFNRAVKRLPKNDVEALRKLEGERIQDLRFRIWNELGGRPDPQNPNDPNEDDRAGSQTRR
jgi:hypothetical protein